MKNAKTIDDFHELALCALDAAADEWVKLLATPKRKPFAKNILREFTRYAGAACRYWKRYKDMSAEELMKSFKPQDTWIGNVKTTKIPVGETVLLTDKLLAKYPKVTGKWKSKPNHPWKLQKIGAACGNADKRKKALAEVRKRARMFAT